MSLLETCVFLERGALGSIKLSKNRNLLDFFRCFRFGGSIFHPLFDLLLGAQERSKRAPRALQERPKSGPRTTQDEPKAAKKRPRATQERLRVAQERPKEVQSRLRSSHSTKHQPKKPQEQPKSAPEPTRDKLSGHNFVGENGSQSNFSKRDRHMKLKPQIANS